MMRHAFLAAMGLFALLALVAACRQQPVAFEYAPTPIEGWEPGDTLKFKIDTLRQTGTYTLDLGIRTSASTPYPFRSIWLVVRQHWHRPERVLTDTVECKLTDAKGDITGHGVSLYQYTQPLGEVQLQEGDYADFSIIHIMRREMLPGVAAVGIRLSQP